MVVIGITGNIGSGKTTVAKLFARCGARIIDADRIAHRLIKPQTRVWGKIVQSFGREILIPTERINHKRLARVAFANARNWRLLCNIVHPSVIKVIKKEIQQARSTGKKVVVLDAALLIESGLDRLVDKTVVVKAELNQQIKRAKKNLSLSTLEIKKRIRFQFPLREKLKRADFIIDNRKGLAFTERQVEGVWKKIISSQR
jgi:dephospho-CoA kinase